MGYFLANSRNFQLNKSKKSAFSLIELSIVLIIGLLVAGVTGGVSLIQSAKTRALMGEIRNYKQAANSYYDAKGKLPGDINNSGQIGKNSGNDYGGNDEEYPECNREECTPFVDLAKENILDYSNIDSYTGKMSNILKNTFYFYVYLGSRDTDGSYLDGFNSNNLELTSKYGSFVPVDMAFAVDQKMDDGLYNSGSIRSLCNERIGYDKDYPDFDDYTATIDYNNGMKSKNAGCDEMTFKLEI